jgi:hypothetical protein
MPDFEEPWLPGYLTRYDPASHAAVDTLAAYDFVAKAPPGAWNPFPSTGHAVLSGRELVTVRSDVPELRWRALTGEPRLILRWNPVREFPTDDHWEAFRADLRPELRRVNPGASEADVDRMVERSLSRFSVDPNEPLPLFGTLHGDDQGRAWLGEHVPSRRASPRQYDVVDAAGRWLGSVELPHGSRILDIRGDKVLAAFMDDMDVTGIVVYRIQYLDR